eukprot:357754-Chlamydomonas_euryale.AAC.7
MEALDGPPCPSRSGAAPCCSREMAVACCALPGGPMHGQVALRGTIKMPGLPMPRLPVSPDRCQARLRRLSSHQGLSPPTRLRAPVLPSPPAPT